MTDPVDDLGRRFARGGEAELEEVIGTYEAKLFRYCNHILRDYHAAEDVVQTVFFNAYSARTQFAERASLSTWLHRIAYNACMDYLRKNKPALPLFEAQAVPVHMEDPDEFSQEVLTALSRLKPKERSVVYGRIVEEYSYNELSEISGDSPTALRKRYERARRKLAEDLRSASCQKRER